jgi:diacylglycerol kinase (ATP)
MNRKIIYIINPIAGTGTRSALQHFIEQETQKKNIPYKIFPSVESGNYHFLKLIIKEEKITDVVIAGGDGTVSAVVGSLLNENVHFGIIPCGSGNGLARGAGISTQRSKALQNVFAGKPQLIDGFKVNEKFACMLCGVGFDAQVAHDFANHPRRGLKTYVKEILRNFISAKTYSFQLELRNKRLKTDSFFISVANSNQFGNSFTIAPKASLSDGLLDIVIVTKQNKLSFVLQTLRQVAGWNQMQTSEIIHENKSVIYFQTDKLFIKNLNEAPIHIDGEPCNLVKEIRIEIVPKCFHLIQPV